MPKKRILIVDDEIGFVRVLKLALEKTGRYIVRGENDATAALDAAIQFRPDVIFLDVVMPRLRGAELARQIRANPCCREIPILFLTGTIESERDGATTHIGDFLAAAKPIGLQEIIELIETSVSSTVAV